MSDERDLSVDKTIANNTVIGILNGDVVNDNTVTGPLIEEVVNQQLKFLETAEEGTTA